VAVGACGGEQLEIRPSFPVVPQHARGLRRGRLDGLSFPCRNTRVSGPAWKEQSWNNSSRH
jgi:hypothetical protein